MFYTVKCISPCKTYREELRCRTLEEANKYAEAIRANGWFAKVEY